MDERKNELEAELRCLHSDLYYSDEVGDWKLIRSLERTIKTLKDATTVKQIANHFNDLYNELQEYIEEREQMRNKIDTNNFELVKIDDHQYEVVKPSFDADNPIDYVDGMELVNNAFYRKDGQVYVYMNGEFIEW